MRTRTCEGGEGTFCAAPVVTLAVLALVGCIVAAVWAMRAGAEKAALVGGNGPATRIDLNRAGIEDLQVLTGVGPVISRRIVEDRARVGSFGSVDDLLRVEGVTGRLLERIRSSVEVGEMGETRGTGDGSE